MKYDSDRWMRIIHIRPFIKLFASEERCCVGVVFSSTLTKKQHDRLEGEGLRFSHRNYNDDCIFFDDREDADET